MPSLQRTYKDELLVISVSEFSRWQARHPFTVGSKEVMEAIEASVVEAEAYSIYD